MEKLTYKELKALFRKHEAARPDKHLTGRIVFREESWPDSYPLDSRTYEISSHNKAFLPFSNGSSIFGNCIDGSDQGVRLDDYMAEERGGRDGWKVEYCYLV